VNINLDRSFIVVGALHTGQEFDLFNHAVQQRKQAEWRHDSAIKGWVIKVLDIG
jgi:hypothetical protein